MKTSQIFIQLNMYNCSDTGHFAGASNIWCFFLCYSLATDNISFLKISEKIKHSSLWGTFCKFCTNKKHTKKGNWGNWGVYNFIQRLD